MRGVPFALVVGLSLLATPGSVGAVPGDLDPGWGGDGVVDSDAPISMLAAGGGDRVVEVANDVSGYDTQARLRRYLADGSLDPTFGGDGVVDLTLPRRAVVVHAAAGGFGVVTVGWDEDGHLMVVRLHPDGTLDPGFNRDGFAFAPIEVNAGLVRAADIWVGATGEIRVAAEWLIPDIYAGFTRVYRFGPRGSLLGTIDSDRPAVLARNGDLLVQGANYIERRSAVTGRFQRWFGDSGRVPNRCTAGRGGAVVTDPTGGLLIVCRVRDRAALRIVRMLRDGTRDPSFGIGGVATLRVREAVADAFAADVMVDRRGRIVISVVIGAGHEVLWVGQLSPTGAWDSAFGDAGRAVVRRANAVVDPSEFPYRLVQIVTAHRLVVAADAGASTQLLAIDRV